MGPVLERTGRSTGVLTGALIAALAVVCGRAVVETQAIGVGTGPLLLGVAAVLAAAAVMMAGPVICIAMLVGLSIVPLPAVGLIGEVDVKPADAFYVGLLVWAALRLVAPSAPRSGRPAVRSTPILGFVGAAGLSLLYVAAVDPQALTVSFVSLLRLVQTLSVAFLAAIFLRSPRDVSVVLTAVAVAGVITVAMALIGGTGAETEDAVGTRGGGMVNPNALGLVSGMLVLLGVLGGLGRQGLYRIPVGVVGALGLVQSESVGSIVGTCVAVTLGVVLLHAHRASVPGLHVVRAIAALAVALGLAYGLGSAIRPENLPHSDSFRQSSAWHRAVTAAAGMELVARNPVIGVGWRRSSQPDVIGDPALTRDLRTRFPGTRQEFFPDVDPGSVHNTYVQIAAELGLIGLALLGVVLLSLGRDIRRLLRSIPRGTLAWRQLWYLTWAVVLSLVWLNDNPLFGGQPETVLLFTFVGAIAGLGTRVNRPGAQVA